MAKHNNIDPTIGNFYHYYVVVDKLFDLKNNEKLVLEVDGDLTKVRISDKVFLENYEIKHHKNKNELNSSNIDFWKTIKNWVENYKYYTSETKLVLYTTSFQNSDLDTFELKTKKEKYDLVNSWRSQTKNAEIKKLFDVIFKNKTTLENVLYKMTFDVEQKKYSEIIDQIIETHHNYFDSFLDNKEVKINAIKFFIGNIVYALKNKNQWEISSKDFIGMKNDFQNKNRIGSIIIEESDLLDNEDEKTSFSNDIKNKPLYIKKLEEISLGRNQIKFATKTKVRAFKFANKLRQNKFAYYDLKIEKCKNVYRDKLEDIHMNYEFEENESLNLENSKELYKEAMNINKVCFHDEDRTESFKKGFWHILSDDEKENITWLIKENNL